MMTINLYQYKRSTIQCGHEDTEKDFWDFSNVYKHKNLQCDLHFGWLKWRSTDYMGTK